MVGQNDLFSSPTHASLNNHHIRPHNIQLIEDEVIRDLENDFPDFKAEPEKEVEELKAWAPVQPQSLFQPLRHATQKQDTDDDATDGGKSHRTFNTLEKIYSGEDENNSYQSYGYSLEDGLVSKTSVSPTGTVSIAESGPMKMDLYALNSSRYNFTEDEDTVNVSVGVPAGDGDESSIYSGLTMDDDKTSSKVTVTEETGYVRECMAPAGKLGVVIDTTSKGPVVWQVKAGSPLQDIIFVGDRIIAIDDIDTRGLSASTVTKIMARKCDQPRKLKVLSDIYRGE